MLIHSDHFDSDGTFIAFDAETPEKRDAFVKAMRLKGINMGGCGEKCKSFFIYSYLTLSSFSQFDYKVTCVWYWQHGARQASEEDGKTD